MTGDPRYEPLDPQPRQRAVCGWGCGEIALAPRPYAMYALIEHAHEHHLTPSPLDEDVDHEHPAT